MKELYKRGKTFDVFLDEGKEEDKKTTLSYLNRTKLDDDLRSRIKKIEKKYNILVLGEIWCPDCMINIPALEIINKANSNIDFKIIAREGNEEKFKDYEVDGKVKIPTIIVMDQDYRELGNILERPKLLKDIYKENNQVEIIKSSKKYRDGEYIVSMIEEILDILK